MEKWSQLEPYTAAIYKEGCANDHLRHLVWSLWLPLAGWYWPPGVWISDDEINNMLRRCLPLCIAHDSQTEQTALQRTNNSWDVYLPNGTNKWSKLRRMLPWSNELGTGSRGLLKWKRRESKSGHLCIYFRTPINCLPNRQLWQFVVDEKWITYTVCCLKHHYDVVFYKLSYKVELLILAYFSWWAVWLFTDLNSDFHTASPKVWTWWVEEKKMAA